MPDTSTTPRQFVKTQIVQQLMNATEHFPHASEHAVVAIDLLKKDAKSDARAALKTLQRVHADLTAGNNHAMKSLETAMELIIAELGNQS